MRLVAVSSLIAAASAGEPPHGTPGPRRRLQEKGLRVCIQKMIYDGYQGGNGRPEGEPKGFNSSKTTQWKSYEANRWANDDGFSEPPQPEISQTVSHSHRAQPRRSPGQPRPAQGSQSKRSPEQPRNRALEL